ncbi:nitric oxide reductase activation protein NorD [Leptospira sanjuanensis]|uniref:nitric oxide reductase activation protein NorD n=1 Tax=Leptospira sanjuanensis TaxID=2879643 RepID=UPI001EE91368|nr:VWA domain-containing protein [Leptospira sanjuanensis]MCG6167714.1 VWA domain-containing protein [Leptospira sanjuanensis]
MSWEEFTFKQLYRFFRIGSQDPDTNENSVSLAEIKDRLSILAKALTGENIEILTAEKEGGYQKRKFFLPAIYTHAHDKNGNLEYYIFRILYLTEQKRLGLNWEDGLDPERNPSIQKAKETYPLVLRSIADQYPDSLRLVNSVIETEVAFREKKNQTFEYKENLSLLHGVWMSAPKDVLPEKDSAIPKERLSGNDSIETEEEGVVREKINPIQVDRKSQKDYTLQHHFEKVDTIEEFNGNWRDFDGSDELEEQKEALRELDLRNTVRSDDPTHSIFRTEYSFGSALGETEDVFSNEESVSYDEWDFGKKKYKKGYCSVFPKTFLREDPAFYANAVSEHRAVLNALRSRFNRFVNERNIVKRQLDGEDIDLDSIVEHSTDVLSGRSPSERIYLSKRKATRDVSILILTDTSLSTDSFVENRRILDVEKVSLLLFGQLCSEYGDRFQMDCFSSRTRNHCDYFTIKRFEDDWEKTRNKIGAVQASGYTRIGPAIRHALTRIEREKSSKRWILLLSDGKPNDYDRYEGRYGIEDVKQAIRECEKQNVGFYALAIDKQAKQYLPSMLGHGSYRILPNPVYLPDALSDFYMKLIK